MKALLVLGLVLSLAVACGPSSQEEGGPGDGTGGDGDNGDNGDNGDQTPVSCDNAAACSTGQVCDPASSTCTGDLDCTSAADCGNGGLCGPGGACVKNTTGGVCEGTGNCLTGETCTGGYCGCDGVAFEATPVRPNMHIVLDRSYSMTESGGTGGSKWTIAGTALNNLLDEYGARARFGLNMFAADDWCSAGSNEVAPADGTETSIRTAIQNSDANSNTPITATMTALVGYSGLTDTSRPNYILLLTDGAESCDDFSTEAVTDLRTQDPPVKTFVVGFGSGVDADQLNELATEGGTALPGTTKYYQADSATELNAAIDGILGSVLSCSYSLDQVPDDVADLYVYQDDVAVDRDPSHADGWDYDASTETLTFYGGACDGLQGGDVTDLNIVYGCPSPAVD
jgi:hypothetical protein